MIININGQVRISFIHRVVEEGTGEFQKYTFKIWIGKTGYGKKIIDRYRTGVCYQELSIPLTEFTCKGKQYKKAILYNPSFEIIDYDSEKMKKVCTVWKLKSFDKEQVSGEQIISEELNLTEDTINE